MNRIIRNIVIVALFTVGGGWLGIWLNTVTGNTQPPMQSLGALVWLTSPALSGIFLRAFGGDGWKDSGFGLNRRLAHEEHLRRIRLARIPHPTARCRQSSPDLESFDRWYFVVVMAFALLLLFP